MAPQVIHVSEEERAAIKRQVKADEKAWRKAIRQQKKGSPVGGDAVGAEVTR